MDATVVYQVAQALSKEERLRLYNMLKNDFVPKRTRKGKAQYKFTKEDAYQHLLKNVFNKKR